MNPHTGEIREFNPSRGEAIPRGWLALSPEEARAYLTLPLDLRIQHYIRDHRTAKCKACGCFIGNHSLRRFKEVCAVNELARFEVERLEELLAGSALTLPEAGSGDTNQPSIAGNDI